ncbi:MAG TPA: hypothetical protein VEC96_14115 [Anaerolineae bacterium]|nr:hypothetical protein [Anaerolineae bacterium]
MLTPEQVAAWTKAALHHLEHLRGPVLCWEEPYPIPIRFCDGHAVHQSDLRELRETFLLSAEAVHNRTCGEDGNLLGVSVLSVFVALYGMIVNAQRV